MAPASSSPRSSSAGTCLSSFLPGENLPSIFLLATAAVTFVYTWLFNHTDRNLLMLVLAHAAEGTITLGALGFVGADDSRMSLLYTGAWTVAAIALLVFDWEFWRGRSSASRPTSLTAIKRPAPVSLAAETGRVSQ